MKSTFLFIIFSLCILKADAQNYWAKTIQTTLDNAEGYRSKTFVDSSGNIYHLNHLQQNFNITNMISVSKLDGNGNLIWSYLYTSGMSNINYAYMVKSKDNLPVVLLINGVGLKNFSFTLLKLDNQGNIFQSKSSNLNQGAAIINILPTDDAGFLIYGVTLKTKFGAAYVLKFDSIFNCEWTYSHKVGGNQTYAWCATETKNNYFIGGRYSLNYSISYTRPYILKLNKKGRAIKAKIISNELQSQCSAITKLNNGNLLISHSSSTTNKTTLTEIDQSLNIISQKQTVAGFHLNNMIASDIMIYMFTSEPNGVKFYASIFDKDGNYLLSIDNGKKNIGNIIPYISSTFLIQTWPGWYENYFDFYKLDTLVNPGTCIMKYHNLSLSSVVPFDSLLPLTNHHYQPTDTIINIAKSANTITITDFCLSMAVDEHSTDGFSIYPNPAATSLTISQNKSKEVIILNLMGEIVFEKHFESVNADKTVLDISFLPSGIYLIKSGNELRKFIKL